MADACDAIQSKSSGDVVDVHVYNVTSGSTVDDIGRDFFDRLRIP